MTADVTGKTPPATGPSWRVLLQITQDLAAELDLNRLLEKVLRLATQVMDARAGSLLMYNAAHDELVFVVVEGGSGEALKNTAIRSSQGIAGACFTSRQPIIADDVARDARFYKGLDESFGFHTTNLIAIPLIAQGRAIGVLEVLNKISGERFTPDDQDLLLALATQSAIAIQTARLYQQVVRERDRLVTAETAARHELARDLHDGPTQLVSAMVMNIRFLRELFQRAPDRAADELIELEALAQKALYQMRNMLFDLHPVVLEKQGVRAALEAYVERLRLLEPFTIYLNVDSLAARWNHKVEASLFLIIQEAITNVKKHSNAHNLWLDAEQKDGHAVITIRDDGQGFDLQQTEVNYDTRGSLGLLSMKERAEVAGGTLQITSQEGRGTTVLIHVPLEPSA